MKLAQKERKWRTLLIIMKEEVSHVRKTVNDINSLRCDFDDLHENMLNIQTRSMRDNLIF